MKNALQFWSALLLLSLSSSCATSKPTTVQIPPSVAKFQLTGDLSDTNAAFALNLTVRVEARNGGTLELLSGPVAITKINNDPKWHLRAEQNRFFVDFDTSGNFAIELNFNATLSQLDNWRSVNFQVPASSLEPIALKGLPADTQFKFIGAARPERRGDDFLSFLPSDGNVKLAWNPSPAAGEGKLFYSAEMLSQISVSPGLMRQTSLLEGKVMQGELSRVTFTIHGNAGNHSSARRPCPRLEC